MILKSIKYKVPDGGWHFEGRGGIPLNLGQINLVVGQNATGKTKTIENILFLVTLISQTIIFNRTVTLYELIFDNNGSEIFYHLNFDKNGIQEILKVDNELKLDRKAEKLFYEEQGQFLPFKTRDMTLAITNSNTLQHPFFEHIHNWSRNILHYQFGGHMGRKNTDFNKRNNIVPDRKDEAFFIDLPSICEKGQQEFGENFNTQITKDFNSIGYNIENITYVNKSTVGFLGIIELGEIVFHTELSQGMFRALSLIIQLNYSLLSNTNPA